MVVSSTRPTPDELLAKVKVEEEQPKRGRLKIFLGYAAGVGKTYTMLEAACQRKNELDVAVAYVETHGRTETESLLEGLGIIPYKRVKHGALTLTEMDLDGVLARHPKLALVDELAHSNPPDSRHHKRYQDVEELLDAGIDVYTTLNIQHIESLRDVVAQITGVWMRETVPDSVIDNAAEIEIVDLPPDELLKRLREGKVYIPEQISHATARFFRKGNLTALRELTMRTAATHVDRHKREYMAAHAIRGPWPSAERLLVCISPSPLGPRLVRTARRMADQLGAEWFALYVETPDRSQLSPHQQNRLMNTLRLAERMGAKAVTVQADSVAPAVAEFASNNNITEVIVGKSQRNRWRRLFARSVVNQIIRQGEHFDVHVVTSRGERAAQAKQAKREGGAMSRNWRGYLQGVGLVVLATLMGQLMQSVFAQGNLLMIYLLCVTVAAIFWGFGPSILVSVLSMLAFNLLFVPPSLTFSLSDTQYLFTVVTLLLVGIIISYLTARIRGQTEAARRRERETAALYALSRDLTVSNDLNSYIRAIIRRTKEIFGREAVIFLPDAERRKLKPYPEDSNLPIDDKEAAAAFWSFQHQKAVGYGTDTLPSARARYLPLITARGAVGVMALWAPETPSELTIERERLLDAYADLAAVAIEGILLSEEVHDAQVLRATEKLQTALLSSISYDLRAPLLSVIGALNTLKEKGMAPAGTSVKDLVQVASDEAETLNHMITNLIDQSRIDAGAVTISRRPSDVQDIISAAMDRLAVNLSERQVTVNVQDGLPSIYVDFTLIVQALVNILDNSLKYSGANSPIEISARLADGKIQLEVADRGIGIPPEDLTRVFDKFYRVQRPDNVIGTGLGLSICKGFVEAHGGSIWAENRPGGGTIIELTLPLTAAF